MKATLLKHRLKRGFFTKKRFYGYIFVMIGGALRSRLWQRRRGSLA